MSTISKFQKNINVINSGMIKKGVILLSLVGGYQNALSQSLKLNEKEKIYSKTLDKFIDSGYRCESLNKAGLDNENLIDAEGLLSDQEEDQIELAIEDLKTKHHTKIMLITKDGMTKNGSMNDFGVSFANCTGIGLKNVDNGILIQLDLQDRQAWIEQGRRVEGILTASECGEITDAAVPYFKRGDIKGGIDIMLSTLDILLTPEEVKVLTKAELEEQQRQEAENKLILMNILYTLIGIGMLGTAGYYIIEQKKKYNQQVFLYNSYISDYKNGEQEFKFNIEKVKDIKEQLKQLPVESRLKNEKERLEEKSNNLVTYFNDSNSPIDSYSDSWFEFTKNNGKYMDEQLLLLKQKTGNIQNSNDSIEEYTKEIEKFFNSLDLVKEYKNNRTNKLSYLEHIDNNIKALENKEYTFPIYIKNYNKNKDDLNTIYDTIDSDSNSISDKIKAISYQEKSYKNIIGDDEKFNNMVKIYQTSYKDGESMIINSTDEKHYNNSFDELSTLIPDNLLNKYELGFPLLKEKSQELYNEYKQAYNTKNLEDFSVKYNDLKDYRNIINKKIYLLERNLEEVKNAKIEIPKILKNIEELSKNTHEKLHDNYKKNIIGAEDDLSNYKKQINNIKADWILLLSKLKSLEEILKEIKNNSEKEFKKDKDKKERKRKEEESYTSYTSGTNSGRSSWESGSSGSSSSNFGGGSFGGGGSGSSW